MPIATLPGYKAFYGKLAQGWKENKISESVPWTMPDPEDQARDEELMK